MRRTKAITKSIWDALTYRAYDIEEVLENEIRMWGDNSPEAKIAAQELDDLEKAKEWFLKITKPRRN